MLDSAFLYLAPAAALLALCFAMAFYRSMVSREEGTDVMQRIGEHVRRGAMAYLRQQYRVMLLVFIGLAPYCL